MIANNVKVLKPKVLVNSEIPYIKFYHYLLLFIAGLVSVFAYAPFNFSAIIILSLLILLHIIYNFNESTTKKAAFFCGFSYGIGFFGSQLYWIFYSLYKVIDTGIIVSTIAYIIFILFLSLYIAISTLFYCKLKSSSKNLNFLFLFPSIWVISEWLRGWFFTGFPWSDISYTQVSTSFLKGFYPALGSYAVSWLVMALAASLYMLIINILNNKLTNRKNQLRNIILFFAIILLSGTFLSEQTYTKVYGKPISVALVQGNVAQSAKWYTNDFLVVYRNLVAKAKADLVIIPETAISTFSKYLPSGYLDELTNLAQKNNASLIIGIPKIINQKNNYVNAAMVLTNPYHPYYAKDHLVPFGEYIPVKWLLGPVYKAISLPMVGFSDGGENQTPLVAANQKLAFNICYENGFNSELIGSAKNATIMANLSDMVWYGNTIAKDEHLQISQARALENQRYFIQVTNTGETAIINPEGQIQSVLPVFKQDILTDRIYGRFGETPFEKVGNYPIIIWCGLVLIFAILNRKYRFIS
ncbi:MAG: apolipoprotein N-acyltransferase [Neisseriaceae bacterium]